MFATHDPPSVTGDRIEEMLLSKSQFRRFQGLIYDVVRVSLPDSKRLMLSGRLAKRLNALGMASFEEYSRYLEDPANRLDEMQDLLNVITTNKTEFYREAYHFDFLVNTVLPELKKNAQFAGGRPPEIWSAGCATGEEPYTIAMELAGALGMEQNFNVLATDVSTRVLRHAMRGIYDEICIASIPPDLKRRYLSRGIGKFEGKYRVRPEIRKHVTFGRLNFADTVYGIHQKFHAIFCRNVMIYFDRETQHTTIRKLCEHLMPFGYLFIGHSETLEPRKFGLEKMMPTVYRRVK